MLTNAKEIKEALRKLRDEWGNTEVYLDKTCGSSLTPDMSTELNRIQNRVMKYCRDDLYYLIESIDDTIIEVESTVSKTTEQ